LWIKTLFYLLQLVKDNRAVFAAPFKLVEAFVVAKQAPVRHPLLDWYRTSLTSDSATGAAGRRELVSLLKLINGILGVDFTAPP